MHVYVGLSSSILQEALISVLQSTAPKVSLSPLAVANLSPVASPCIILCDTSRLKELADISWVNIKLIILDTGQSKEQILSFLLAYPIDGVIACDSNLALLVKALQVVSTGQVWVDNSLLKLLLQQAESHAVNREQLSKKERDIVILISQGCRNKDIATRLCISEQTVKTHLSRIFRKLNISTRTQLIPFGMKFRNQS